MTLNYLKSSQLSEKEQRLRGYQESENREQHKEHFTNEQLEDRLRHYEAQAQLVDTLQRELSSAQVYSITLIHHLFQLCNDIVEHVAYIL